MIKKRYGFRIDLSQICLFNSVDVSNRLCSSEDLMDVYENQAKNGMFRDKFSSASRNMMGRTEFSDKEGHPIHGSPDTLQPKPGMRWEGPWKIDESSVGLGSDGWVYSSSWTGTWNASCGITSKVRRRRWCRFMVSDKSPAASPAVEDYISGLKHAHIDGDLIDAIKTTKKVSFSSLWFTLEMERLIKNVVPSEQRASSLPLKPSTKRLILL